MERQVNKAFKSQAPLRKTTKAANAALLRSKAMSTPKNQKNVRPVHGAKRSLSDSDIMIVPPPENLRPLIDEEMRKVRLDLMENMGQEAYGERIRQANEEFERLR